MLSPSSMLMLSVRERYDRRLLAAQDSDRGRIRIVNAAAVGSRLFRRSSVHEHERNMFIPEPGRCFRLDLKHDAGAARGGHSRREIWPTTYLPMASGWMTLPVTIPDINEPSNGIRGSDGKQDVVTTGFIERFKRATDTIVVSVVGFSRNRTCTAGTDTHTYRHPLHVLLGQLDVAAAESELGHRVVVGDRHREFRRSEVVYVGIPCGIKSLLRCGRAVGGGAGVGKLARRAQVRVFAHRHRKRLGQPIAIVRAVVFERQHDLSIGDCNVLLLLRMCLVSGDSNCCRFCPRPTRTGKG